MKLKSRGKSLLSINLFALVFFPLRIFCKAPIFYTVCLPWRIALTARLPLLTLGKVTVVQLREPYSGDAQAGESLASPAGVALHEVAHVTPGAGRNENDVLDAPGIAQAS